MPCYDGGGPSYSDNTDELRRMKARIDLLARVACRALTELEDNGIADFLLLRDDETREFWEKHKEFDRKRRAAEAEKLRLEEVKKAALAKLTDEEKAALGIDVLKALSPAAFSKKKKTSSAMSLPARAIKADIVKDMEEIMKEAYNKVEFGERDK
jgi:hypothetical protein